MRPLFPPPVVCVDWVVSWQGDPATKWPKQYIYIYINFPFFPAGDSQQHQQQQQQHQLATVGAAHSTTSPEGSPTTTTTSGTQLSAFVQPPMTSSPPPVTSLQHDNNNNNSNNNSSSSHIDAGFESDSISVTGSPRKSLGSPLTVFGLKCVKTRRRQASQSAGERDG